MQYGGMYSGKQPLEQTPVYRSQTLPKQFDEQFWSQSVPYL